MPPIEIFDPTLCSWLALLSHGEGGAPPRQASLWRRRDQRKKRDVGGDLPGCVEDGRPPKASVFGPMRDVDRAVQDGEEGHRWPGSFPEVHNKRD
eukprot:scaffold155_cov347-Pavlova_lutheri.AAC.83